MDYQFYLGTMIILSESIYQHRKELNYLLAGVLKEVEWNMSKGKGKKVRLGQMKFKRADNQEDELFEKILADNKFGYLNHVHAEVGNYLDISDLTKKQQLYLMNNLFDRGFIYRPTIDKKFVLVVKLT